MADNLWATIQTEPLDRLEELFQREPDRLSLLTHDLAGIYFDWSKTHLDRGLLDDFLWLAEQRGFEAARDALFAGAVVNPTEGRSATHVAERGSGSPEDVELGTSRHARMRALVDAIEAGAFGDVTGVLHIGIGGSLLGPKLVVDALGRGVDKIRTSFLSNIDPYAFEEAVEPLDPATTLIAVVSKTFTTAETLANMEAALDWLRRGGISDPYGRVIAITASPENAVKAGVDETRILQFAESVGGRYSLWSSVSLVVALALGWSAFEELLEGAAEMDRHFRYSEPNKNVPLLAAFADILYTHRFQAQTRATFAYDERLRLLPFYLQQLETESNGKSVTLSGEPVTGPTAPVIWGGTGTDAQHAVFQLLHQGTELIPVEFLGVIEEDTSLPEHHRQLLLNMFAQAAALMQGRSSDDPHRSYPGNRPSATLLLNRLDARTLGALIAFYEHRTFSEAVLLGINPFDQYGVELGKAIARSLSEGTDKAELDPSTRALVERAGV
jgi:glucose-6-phosphate isomerase